MPAVEVRRGDDRPVTRSPGITAWHSLSFGAHYDPANTSFGQLVALNDELLSPGAGYAEHEHRGVELVTYVVSGTLLHTDSLGGRVELGAGAVQCLQAGSGVQHAERCTSDVPVRFVQAWFVGDGDAAPAHAWAARSVPYGVTLLASGVPAAQSDSVLRLDNAGATLLAVRLRRGEALQVPDADCTSLLVVGGRIELDGVGALQDGDEARLRSAGSRRLVGERGAQVLVWAMAGP